MTIAPVIAGTHPYDVEEKLRTNSHRAVDTIPLPLLSVGEAAELMRHSLGENWITNEKLRLAMLVAGGNAQALKFLVDEYNSKHDIDYDLGWLCNCPGKIELRLAAQLLMEVSLDPRVISGLVYNAVVATCQMTPSRSQMRGESGEQLSNETRFQVSAYVFLKSMPIGDPLRTQALYNACRKLMSGESFELVVSTALVMRLRALVALGKTSVTMREILGTGAEFGDELEFRQYDVTQCETIDVIPLHQESIDSVYKSTERKPGVYTIAQQGVTGRWDILVILPSQQCFAVQCKFSLARKKQPYLAQGTISAEHQLHRKVIGSEDGVPLVFVCQFPLGERAKPPAGTAVVDNVGCRSFFTHAFADLVEGVFCNVHTDTHARRQGVLAWIQILHLSSC